MQNMQAQEKAIRGKCEALGLGLDALGLAASPRFYDHQGLGFFHNYLQTTLYLPNARRAIKLMRKCSLMSVQL